MKHPPIKIICNIKNIKVKKYDKFIIDIFRKKDHELDLINKIYR